LPKLVANNRVEQHSDGLFADSDSFVACGEAEARCLRFSCGCSAGSCSRRSEQPVIVPVLTDSPRLLVITFPRG